MLAKLCRDKMLEFKARAGKDCDMLLLENHGIFVAADTVDALGEKLSFVLDSIDRSLSEKPDFDKTPTFDTEAQQALLSAFPQDTVCREVPFGVSKSFVGSADAANELMRPFTPDHIVYCRAYPLWLGESEKRAATAEMLFEDAADIAVYSRAFGGASHMTEELTDFITNWEVEAYRSSQNG